MSRFFVRYACAVALAVPALSVHAEIVIGVDVSTTGPAAAIGIQTNNAIRLWPNTLGGEPARFALTPSDLSAWAARQQVASPLAMTTLSTHDTKRGEDARAKIAASAQLVQLYTGFIYAGPALIRDAAAPPIRSPRTR